ncbi:WUSCHEL-related homeobox 8 [Linum grandiflorum]
MRELQQLDTRAQLENGGGGEEGAMYSNGGLIGNGVKVMTDEQMEMLRKQISVYATICDRLVQMHSSFALNRHEFPGMLQYGDPLSSCGPSKIPSRQRWAPKQSQLQILEQIFSECNSNPGKERIKEITAELSKYGQVRETSVYNWFQNRRARCKRKQSAPAPRTGNFDVEAARIDHSAAAKQKIPEDDENHNSPLISEQFFPFQTPDNIVMDQLMGFDKMKVSEGYNICYQEQQNGLS